MSSDARAVSLEATPRGVRVMQEGRRRRVEHLAAALEALSADELRLLSDATDVMERVSR